MTTIIVWLLIWWIVIALFVRIDAKRFDCNSAQWAWIVFIFGVFGLIAYLFRRPSFRRHYWRGGMS